MPSTEIQRLILSCYGEELVITSEEEEEDDEVDSVAGLEVEEIPHESISQVSTVCCL
jgi:hypothetical protein